MPRHVSSVVLAVSLLTLGACKRSRPADETPAPTPTPFECSRAALADLEPEAGALLSRAAIPSPPPEDPPRERRVVTCMTGESGGDCAERALRDVNATMPEGATAALVSEMPGPEETRDRITVLVTGPVVEPEAPVGERWSWFPDDKKADPEDAVATLEEALSGLDIDVEFVSRGGPGSLLVDVTCRNPPPEEEEDAEDSEEPDDTEESEEADESEESEESEASEDTET